MTAASPIGSPAQEVTFLIIGAGFSGLGAAIRLRQEGYTDLIVLERAERRRRDLARQHLPRLPLRRAVEPVLLLVRAEAGLERDVPVPARALGLPAQVTTRYGLRPYLRFGHEVTGARWDAGGGRWQVTTTRGTFAGPLPHRRVGSLVEPSLPDIPGIESFQGTIMHSARWDHGWQAAGRRVAVVGTGASAIQIVPSIQPQVEPT